MDDKQLVQHLLKQKHYNGNLPDPVKVEISMGKEKAVEAYLKKMIFDVLQDLESEKDPLESVIGAYSVLSSVLINQRPWQPRPQIPIRINQINLWYADACADMMQILAGIADKVFGLKFSIRHEYKSLVNFDVEVCKCEQNLN